MKLLILSNLYPKQIENDIRAKQKFNMYDAANELQWNLIDGFIENKYFDEVKLCNIIPVDSWPEYYSDIAVAKHIFSVDNKSNSVSVPFCNIKFLKHKSIEHSFVNEAVKLCDSDEYCILVYSLNATFLKAIKNIKEKHCNVKCIAVVADLPQFTSTDKNFLRRYYKKMNTERINEMMKYIDGYVLLTKQMADKLNINVPSIVMEGIAKNNPYTNQMQEKFSKKTVLYTGSLNKRYGVLHLIEAFKLIEDSDYRLLLCGMGDAEEEINKQSSIDSRIKLLGKVPHDQVLKLQCKSHVLVNPRKNDEEYTKYSFPSKTLEYLASGTPVVAYKLDGIPDEYDLFLRYPLNDTVDELKNTIINVVENSVKNNGLKSFLEKKSNLEQTKRIIEFIMYN